MCPRWETCTKEQKWISLSFSSRSPVGKAGKFVSKKLLERTRWVLATVSVKWSDQARPICRMTPCDGLAPHTLDGMCLFFLGEKNNFLQTWLFYYCIKIKTIVMQQNTSKILLANDIRTVKIKVLKQYIRRCVFLIRPEHRGTMIYSRHIRICTRCQRTTTLATRLFGWTARICEEMCS